MRQKGLPGSDLMRRQVAFAYGINFKNEIVWSLKGGANAEAAISFPSTVSWGLPAGSCPGHRGGAQGGRQARERGFSGAPRDSSITRTGACPKRRVPGSSRRSADSETARASFTQRRDEATYANGAVTSLPAPSDTCSH